MAELWQLYDESGSALSGQGATWEDVLGKGLLHGASHVWVWRVNDGQPEVLLQQRAAQKNTWPNRLDISAAGHIDLGEDPLAAAIRETKEEIGIEVDSSQLQEIARVKAYLTADSGAIENEFQWLYLLELPQEQDFNLQKSEVKALVWKSLEDFEAEYETDRYVPHGKNYYAQVIQNASHQ